MSSWSFTTILWTLLALLIGCSSQVVQQQYFPRGRYFGREWTFVTRTQPLDGQPPGILVTRTRDGFLAYDRDQQIIGDPNRIPASILDEDPQQGIAEDGNPVPQSRVVDQASSTDVGLSGAVESQTGSEMGSPVEVDAEEGSYVYNNRKKRDYSSWKIFNRLSPSKFFSDRQIRDTKVARESRCSRAETSASKSNSVGITERRIVPFVEDVNEPRYRRGTDDNLSTWHYYYYRSPRNAETEESQPQITSWGTSGAGVEDRSTNQLYFDFPILTEWFKV